MISKKQFTIASTIINERGFPRSPSYQAFDYRINNLQLSFQVIIE